MVRRSRGSRRVHRLLRRAPPLAGAGEEQARDQGGGGLPRHASQGDDLDPGRRRLGLRYRLRRSGPRHGFGRRHQVPGRGHGDVREHGRPAVEGHADVRRGEVRRGRQASDEEGPGQAHDGLQERVRGVDRGGRGPAPGHQGADRGADVQRPGDRDLLLAVPAARIPEQAGHEPPGRGGAARGGVRLLAAVPLRSAPRGEGREPVPAGFQEAEGQGQRLPRRTEPVQHPRETAARRGRAAAQAAAGGGGEETRGARAHGDVGQAVVEGAEQDLW